MRKLNIFFKKSIIHNSPPNSPKCHQKEPGTFLLIVLKHFYPYIVLEGGYARADIRVIL